MIQYASPEQHDQLRTPIGRVLQLREPIGYIWWLLHIQNVEHHQSRNLETIRLLAHQFSEPCTSKLTTMPWRETQPGLWQRPIGDNEKFIHFIGDRAHGLGREHWSVRASATFTTNQPLASSELGAQCLEAWCALRFAHPSIACTVEGDVLSYVVPSSESIADWAKETCTIHEPGANAADVMANLSPSKYTSCHLFPDESMFFLQIAHWRTDGYGALQLVNALLDNLCKVLGDEDLKLRWGDEPPRLTPGIEEALKLPIAATQDIVDATKDCMKTLDHGNGAVGMALKGDGGGGPAGTRNARFRLIS
jgi:hypothetical protein